ncbi:MAG: hypothetical protein V2G49_04975 [bacterium JZ-2024 1]
MTSQTIYPPRGCMMRDFLDIRMAILARHFLMHGSDLFNRLVAHQTFTIGYLRPTKRE